MVQHKVMTLKEAIKSYLKSGDSIALGGCTTNRKPYAAVSEIIRQGIKDLYIHGGNAGGDSDMLIGADCCKVYINAYCANSGYTNVCRRYRKYIEEKKILVEDYSLDIQAVLFHAAALGLPYVPVKHMLGSDLVEKWGISEEIRAKDDKLPNKKIIVNNNPFNPDEKLCLVPTPEIDVAIIHVQKASVDGTARIEGARFSDLDMAMAAKYCIITCEEIVDSEELRRDPYLNCIPSIVTDAVVHAPFGAHPSQVYNYYDYDRNFYRMYDKVSRDDKQYEKFLHDWVYSCETHKDYLAKLGVSRLNRLKVIKGIGYVPSGWEEVIAE